MHTMTSFRWISFSWAASPTVSPKTESKQMQSNHVWLHLIQQQNYWNGSRHSPGSTLAATSRIWQSFRFFCKPAFSFSRSLCCCFKSIILFCSATRSVWKYTFLQYIIQIIMNQNGPHHGTKRYNHCGSTNTK